MNKSFQKQVILLISLLIFLVSNASATHYAGGELTWKCVMEGGVSKYKFKLIVYRNCARPDGTPAADIGNVGDLSTIQVDNLNGVLSQTLNTGRVTAGGDINITLIEKKDVSPSCSFGPGGPLDCSIPDQGALEKHTFVSQPIDFRGVLPPTDANTPFIFSWTSFARNDGIVNIGQGNSGSLGIVFLSKMYPFFPNGSTNAKPVSECFDSAPEFTEAPAAILYTTGLDFVFNNNANDPDLDNLYYNFAEPVVDLDEVLNNTYDPASLWTNYPYYNAANPMGLLPSQYSFNNFTGEYTFKPLVSGYYVTAFKVASYKCDQKVSEVFRDFQSRILVPDENQNTNRFPDVFPPFIAANGTPSKELNVLAGKTLLIPIVVRDSTAGGLDISAQNIELTVNGLAMGFENADIAIGCPYPPCAILTRNKYNYVYGPSTPKPVAIANVPGEIFGYGFDLGTLYGKASPDTVWLYWPTTCANLAKTDDCNGLTSSRYNFVVTGKDNFCRVPGKSIRTFSVNLLPPDFYLSPPIRCITYDQNTHHVTFNWGVASGDTNTFIRYEIYRNNTLLTTEFNRNVYSYVDMSINASPDSTYYVRSINLCDVEDEVSPVKPITVEAFFYKNNQARLTWNPIRSPKLRTALGYNVYRSQTENPYNWVEVVDGDGDTTNTAAIDFVDLCGDTTYYKIEALDSLGCASISNIDTIFHQDISASFHSDTVCLGTPTQFVLDNLSGGIPPYSTVRWLGDEGFSAGNNDTVLYLYPTYGVKHFKFTVIDSKGCRIDIDDSTYVRQLPEFEIQKDSACPGAAINFNLEVKTPVGIDSVFWLGDYNVDSGRYLFNKKGIYSTANVRAPIWIFYSNGGVGSFPISVMIRDTFGCETIMYDTVKTGEPTIELLNDPSLCYDTKKDSIHMLPKYLTKPFNTVQWIDNNNSQVLYQANDGKDAFPLSVVAGRRYIDLRVRIEDSKGCKGEVTQIYTLSPWIDFLPDSLCIGDVANLRTVHKPISDTANYRYLWELDANTVDTVRLPNHIYTSNGPKIITLLVTDIVTGCTTFIKDTLTVRDPMSFKVNVSPNCAGEETVFTRELYKAAIDTAWEWTIDESPNVIPNNTIIFKGNDTCRIILPSNDGYFRVTLRINEQGTGCWTTFDTVMKVFNQPDIDFDVDSLNCAGKITQFVSTVIGSTPPYIYDWSGDDSFTDTAANPSHIYPENGDEYYLVSLSVTNGFGCVVTKTKNVRVCDDKKTMVQVPQIFSPGRERNNTLSVNYTNVDDFEFTVYNRWGIEVFKSSDPDFVWDGKDLSGEYLLTGTYVYIVKANGLGKRNYLNKGTIAILR